MDVSAFYNRYSGLVSVEPQAETIETVPAPMHILVPTSFGNLIYGETHGIEPFASWKVTNWWTLSPGYTYFATHLHTAASSLDTTTVPGTDGGQPDHQAQMRSSVALPWRLQFNSSAYFVNRLPAQAVPSYTRLDAGVTWKAGERISIDVVGQNLLQDHHLEYSGPDLSVQSTLMRRNAYAKLVWFF
jgi:iron complex outermembrane receptor protein